MRTIFLILIVILIQSCTDSSSPSSKPNKIAQSDQSPEHNLSAYLAQQDLSQVNSLSQAILYYKTSFAPKGPTVCDQDFLLLKSFAIESAIAINESSLIEKIKDSTGKIESDDVSKFKKLGFSVHYINDEPYFMSDPTYLLKEFKSCCSEAMQQFIIEFIKEHDYAQIKKTVLDIDADELSRRLLYWENFIEHHPNFIAIEEAKNTYGLFLSQYLAGSEHVKAFVSTARGLVLSPSFKFNYEKLIKENGQTKTGILLDRYYEVLKSNTFLLNKSVSIFLDTVQLPYQTNAIN